MPEWVIVGERADGTPIVLSHWIMGVEWVPIDAVRDDRMNVATFRDRWRAKRWSKRLPRALAPRALRLDRL